MESPNNQPLPFQNRAKHINQTARKRGHKGKISATDLVSILTTYGEECYYCGKELEFEGEDADGTFDHLLPLSRGGRNTKKNLVPCCEPCNGKKGEKVLRYKDGRMQFVWP